MDVIASHDTAQSPEHIGNHPEVRRRRRGAWVEGFVVIPRPGRHDQGAVAPEGITKGLDQAERPTFDRSYCSKGSVHEQDTSLLDTEGAELIGDFGSVQLFPTGSALHHALPSLLQRLKARLMKETSVLSLFLPRILEQRGLRDADIHRPRRIAEYNQLIFLLSYRKC
jgi:hypothetical protein